MLSFRSHGILRFRWVVCQLEFIRGKKTAKDLKMALNALPETLDDTYNRILNDIQEEYKEVARRALQLVIFACRPVTLYEVAEAAVIEDAPAELDDDSRLLRPEDLLNICGSLVTVSGGYLTLCHFSVQEYLQSSRIRDGAAAKFAMDDVRANIELSKLCLNYLSLAATDDIDSAADVNTVRFYDRWPFLSY